MYQNDISSSDNCGRTLNLKEMKEERDEEEEEEEEEEEDVDFNPFLKETLSQEASSSLSSEDDGLDGDIVNSGISVGTELPKLTTKEQICAPMDSEHGENEIILQSSGMVSQTETDKEKHIDLNSVNDGNSFRTGELTNTTQSHSPIIDIDNEDAICMRTRARYSLEGFSLDELETFLQETDDDDDPQNADDEEEYKKFLAAVLQDGNGDGLSSHEDENPDDDEDNDADFELELEELLESDGDENVAVETQNERDGAGRRPETRQKKRQKVFTPSERNTLGQIRKPLRPILPNYLNGPRASGKNLMPEATPGLQSPASGNGLVNGFTPQQIGQLYCLIHEHVQLLIQVFSLSVLEPSHKQIASQVQGLLCEMVHKRDEVLALKRAPYPGICFTPSLACTSVSNRISQFIPGQCSIEFASTQDAHSVCFPQSHQSSFEGLNGQRSCFQDTEGSFWFPFVRGPVQSILDVAPLKLVRRYVDDMYSAAQEFRKRYIESGYDSVIEKEPLFPFSSSIAGANTEVSSGIITETNNTVSTSGGRKKPKKTLAAMLIESTKKQSIALVPKEVAKLTQRFSALFNPALFPHKPPPAAVVNRMLFTDSEDELLALGILEYNTDWKAIQQRFLPCKSKHQIFVRQKNRCSSKALENPIKAVRRMKTSPLTVEEITYIQEGLKLCKFDWMSVWQYIVPHRDPSLLPRQWRVALGTQKSYKLDAEKREKRRLYESKRRKLKATAPESWQDISSKEDCEAEIADRMDYSNVPYVHQAFLADWRPDTSTLNYTEHVSSTPGERILAHDANQHAFPSVSMFPQPFHSTSDLWSGMKGAPGATTPKPPVFCKTSSSKYYCRPYRSRKAKSTQLVKLAPDLPPVNLPPSVRVVSQTAFNGFQCGTSKINPPGGGLTASGKDNPASQIPHGEKIVTIHPAEGARPTPKDRVTNSQLERSETAEGRSLAAEKGTYADLQMHPLLFQVTEKRNMPYYPFNYNAGTSSSFSFFPGRQPQLNLSLFNSSQQRSHVDCANNSLKSKNSTLRSGGGIDFHPLLQKSNDTQSHSGSDAIQIESLVNNGAPDTANISSGLNDNSNELDLNIPLSSVSESEKSRHLMAHNPKESQKTVASCATAMTPRGNSAPYCQQGDRNPSPSSCELASSAPLAIPDDNITRYDVNDVGDQSHPGIVMEQEELSDSEEEIEEHVEFECEEMDDSEADDSSGCEQAPNVQNKEVPISSEENVAMQTAYMKKPYEPRANSDTQVDSSLLKDSAKPNMVLMSDGMDDLSSSSWLSLDSSNPVPSKTMLQRDMAGEDSARRHFTINKVNTDGEHSIDMVQQPSQGPHIFTAPRKFGKHCGKFNTDLNIAFTAEKSDHDDDHEDD